MPGLPRPDSAMAPKHGIRRARQLRRNIIRSSALGLHAVCGHKRSRLFLGSPLSGCSVLRTKTGLRSGRVCTARYWSQYGVQDHVRPSGRRSLNAPHPDFLLRVVEAVRSRQGSSHVPFWKRFSCCFFATASLDSRPSPMRNRPMGEGTPCLAASLSVSCRISDERRHVRKT